MKVYGQLEQAQLQNVAGNLTGNISGRLWFDTSAVKVKFQDGTLTTALLANDQKCVFGTNGTANNNIRFHRGAASVFQFVLGGDTTAEGTLATALAQLSARLENYTTAARPSAGNAGRAIWNTTTSTVQLDNGTTWVDLNTSASIVARADTNAGQSFANNSTAIIDFEDVLTDTHSAITTGASWKFTCPTGGGGYYLVTAKITWSGTNAWAAGEHTALYLRKNSTVFSVTFNGMQGSTATQEYAVQCTAIINLSATDTIDVQAVQGSGGALTLYNGGANYNYVNIARILT